MSFNDKLSLMKNFKISILQMRNSNAIRKLPIYENFENLRVLFAIRNDLNLQEFL